MHAGVAVSYTHLDVYKRQGETYPLVKLEISSTSHPFYTGKSKLVDTAGRVDKFMLSLIHI